MKKMESTIRSIRDVLRKEGVTGMDSINHCIVFLVSRMLNEELCEKFNIDNKFTFYNITKDDTGQDLGNQDLYNRIYNGSKNCLIGQIMFKLGFKNIKFKLEGIHNLKLIYDKLKELNTDTLSTTYDLIGTIYEFHLKSGTSNSMRDLGQYYTHRLVINYMIKLCDPQMKNGMIEKIVDPSMGTGGFLTMSIKYLNDKYNKKINWVKNKDNIIGFDIDDNVKNMALLNVFLEIGELCTDTMIKQDTLHNDMKFTNDGTILEKADVILANEPMGLKNITHASLCDRIKNMKIRGTKAEPLFLQLFMEALNDKGRCAVIIPDGVLFNESNLHKGTRKHLIENFNLSKVVSLNGDFFLNTGVKTSILFFTNDGTKTHQVDFCDIKLINDDELVETSIVKVSYDAIIDMDYSLFVNKYNVDELNKIDGIEYKKLGDICEFRTSRFNSGLMDKTGTYKFYNGKACSPVGYHSEHNFDYTEYIAIIKGGGAGKGKYGDQIGLGKPFYLNGKNAISNGLYVLKLNESNISTKYVFHILLNNKNKIMDLATYTTGLGNIKLSNLKIFEIPIPPMSIQEAIVERLDVLNGNIERSQQMIDEYRNIINYYVDCHTRNEKEYLKLGDICEIKSGKFNSRDKKEHGKYPFYNSCAGNPVGFMDEYCFDYANYIILIKDGGAGQGKYGEQIGLGKTFRVNGKSSATSHQIAIVIKESFDNVTNDYLYWYMSVHKNNIMDLALYTTGLGCIRRSDIVQLKIKIPTLAKQQQIVNYCDNVSDMITKMEQQIQDSKTLMKQIMDSYLYQPTEYTASPSIATDPTQGSSCTGEQSFSPNKSSPTKSSKKAKNKSKAIDLTDGDVLKRDKDKIVGNKLSTIQPTHADHITDVTIDSDCSSDGYSNDSMNSLTDSFRKSMTVTSTVNTCES